jgi:hypothetical protein
MQKVYESLAKWGYAHSEAEAISDIELASSDLLVVRGLTLDTIFRNDPKGRAAWKASQK